MVVGARSSVDANFALQLCLPSFSNLLLSAATTPSTEEATAEVYGMVSGRTDAKIIDELSDEDIRCATDCKATDEVPEPCVTKPPQCAGHSRHTHE